jgi:hypothetical protein
VPKIIQKKQKKHAKKAFLNMFRLFEAVHGFSRLVPDRFPTGSRFAKTGADLRNLVSNFQRLRASKKSTVSG